MLRFAQEIDYYDGVAAAHDQLGKIARDMEMWGEAKKHFEKVRMLCEAEECNLDVSVLMNAMGNLGWVEFNLGNYARGKELCERSLVFFGRIGGRGYSTSLECQLAAIEFALGNWEQASAHAKQALYWAKRLQILRDMERAQGILDRLAEVESNDNHR